MIKKLLLQDDGKAQKVKEISMMQDAQKLKMVLGALSWKILTMLSEEEMYPLEIARRLGVHEQKVYYHIRKLAKAGAITVQKEEKKKGAIAKYYKTVSPAFGIEFPQGYKTIQSLSLLSIDEQIQSFFKEFINSKDVLRRKNSGGQPRTARSLQNQRPRRPLRCAPNAFHGTIREDAHRVRHKVRRGREG